MHLSACTSGLANASADCLTIFVTQDSNLSSEYTSEFSEDNLKTLQNLASSGVLAETAGSSLLVALDSAPAQAVFLYRLGKDPLTAEKTRELALKLVAKILPLNFVRIAVDLSGLDTSGSDVNAAEEIGILAYTQSYRFENFKSKKRGAPKLEELVLISADPELEDTAAQSAILGESINLTRDLGNMPGNACTPVYLAEKATRMAKELEITTRILDEDEMRELGMGSLLSVSAGSDEPARLIVMEYQGAEPSEAPYALVGKGITFDTGGISLKPGAGMDEMKFDMCGAASVFGAVQAVAKLRLPINLVAVVAAAENMPSGCATKPGDVVTSMSGQTIEVLNTDAEGRLVLCDALTYVAKYKPKTIVDIATLTGACVIALGSHASGLYANDDELAQGLLDASTRTGDKAWRMPLWPEYDKQLESNFADIANIGGREAGSVTAACFLARFTSEQKWAHLDIAGTAWKSGKAKGATGRPVRLLVNYLANRSQV